MEKIRTAIAEAVGRVFDAADTSVTDGAGGVAGVTVEVMAAPEGTGADYASNVALKLASVLHKAPMEIAEKLATELKLDEFDVVVAKPGFVNFISRDEYIEAKIGELAENFAENISRDEYFGKVVVTEFSDPNPFKVLHVGHLYTSIMGEAISRLIENAGGEVHRTNFGGDVGLHVAKTLWALLSSCDGDFTKHPDSRTWELPFSQQAKASCKKGIPKSGLNLIRESECLAKSPELEAFIKNLTIEQIAKAYVAGSKAYEEDGKAKQEIVEINKQIYDIALNDRHDSALAELYWRGREISYDYFDKFYARIGVKFERYYPESTVAGLGLAKVREHIGSVYEESAGAVIFAGEKYGLHTRVFINKEGLPTYETKDTGLIFRKFDDYHFDESVVITGNDIIEYMKVVLKAVSLYAPELPERTRHITHGNVRLPGNEKMSSRKGNFLRAVDVIDMVRDELLNQYGSADEKVVMAAVKYAFLKYRIGGDIIFDVKESVSMTGNSGPYILYSVVRAKKILSKTSLAEPSGSRTWELSESQQAKASCDYDTPKSGLNLIREPESSADKAQADFKKLIRPAEASDCESQKESLACKSLSKKLLQYSEVVGEATREKAPHLMCNYLFELAQEFSRFYEKVKVAGSEAEAERAQLVKVFVQVMEHGLNLLGIEVPEEM